MVKQERAARTRESLVHAAAEVFAEEGFAAASIAQISRRAGVTSGALHFHFDGKTSLALAVEERAARAMREAAAVLEERDRAGGPLRVLVGSTYTMLSLLTEDVAVRAAFALCADTAHSGRVDLRRQWRSWVEGVLADAERARLLAEGVALQDAVDLVVALTVGLDGLGGFEPDRGARQLLNRIWTVVLPGIAGGEVAAAVLVEALAEDETD
ncbi:TetR family transcriptional regulator [Streptomyces sp. 3211.6]|uniref:ScbR family autoregulator-binding transcription factor n=1 Tax=Streptomyces sp. 3211.6 TaxID=1938845 RepID=UPI000F2330E9|nr:ScbR family autoregulator-binding transcription factor [Streptomyces sp. 3211.6]RKS96981.1 TetR family transcriptional regulator [Streptomyces sp. 3211.6]